MTSNASVSLNSTVVATPQHLSAQVAGETVILDNESGQYFGLNAVGNEVWTLIQTPKQVSELCEAITNAYDVEREQCEQDMLVLLEGLVAEGLVQMSSAD